MINNHIENEHLIKTSFPADIHNPLKFLHTPSIWFSCREGVSRALCSNCRGSTVTPPPHKLVHCLFVCMLFLVSVSLIICSSYIPTWSLSQWSPSYRQYNVWSLVWILPHQPTSCAISTQRHQNISKMFSSKNLQTNLLAGQFWNYLCSTHTICFVFEHRILISIYMDIDCIE